MTDTPRLWDRRADETPKPYAAFRAYCEMGAKRSVREAARQHCVKTASSGPKNTTVKHWLRWSARHKWVSRSLARDEWIARTSRAAGRRAQALEVDHRAQYAYERAMHEPVTLHREDLDAIAQELKHQGLQPGVEADRALARVGVLHRLDLRRAKGPPTSNWSTFA